MPLDCGTNSGGLTVLVFFTETTVPFTNLTMVALLGSSR